MKKYRIIIKGEDEVIHEHFVDKVSDPDLSNASMKNVTIAGSASSIRQIQRNQDSFTKQNMTESSKLRTTIIYD